MARFTGGETAPPVLEAADYWREHSFMSDGSVLSDAALWTRAILDQLRDLFEGNPIEGPGDFLDKLKEQLADAPSPVVQLAAEVMWLCFLFPHSHSYSPETKASQVRTVWAWSGEAIPDPRLLEARFLFGIGGVGIAYPTRRFDQIHFLLQVMCRWKSLSDGQRADLWAGDAPWGLVALGRTDCAHAGSARWSGRSPYQASEGSRCRLSVLLYVV
jgi:hypothetical protein